MELETYGSARLPEPDESELEAYLAEHSDRFVQPARLSLHHVYFSRDKRGDAAEADARAALARIAAKPQDPRAADAEGDPFMFPRDLGLRSERELAKTFGAGFAARVFDLPVGRFSGPVASAYGEHLVRVHEKLPQTLPELDAVRKEVFESLQEERGRKALQERLRSLRERYAVRVERPTPQEPEGG